MVSNASKQMQKKIVSIISQLDIFLNTKNILQKIAFYIENIESILCIL